MDKEPRRPKLDPNRLWSRPPDLLYGLVGPSLCLLAQYFVHGQVRGPYVLFSHIILSISNQIENPLINNFKTRGKIISVMTKGQTHIPLFLEVLLLQKLFIRDPMLLKLLWNEVQQNSKNLILDVSSLEGFISNVKRIATPLLYDKQCPTRTIHDMIDQETFYIYLLLY